MMPEATDALLTQMQTIQSQMEELTRTTVLWMVVSALLLLFVLVLLLLVLRMRSRNRKVEQWLGRELQGLKDGQNAVYRQMVAMQQRPTRPAGPAQAAPPPKEPPSAEPQAPKEDTPPDTATVDLMPLLNEMLAGNQPYNFVEALRAVAPQVTLQRVTPKGRANAFNQEIILEAGGDGLFAAVSGSAALLFPNYSRFSTTLDPKPLFDGARHGARIHSLLAPARLEQGPDGTWILKEKGKVQMRQGA